MSSVITEVLKGIKYVSNLPAELVAIITSFVVTFASGFMYVSYASITVRPWEIVAAIFTGFIVAFVSMYGWEKLTNLWEKLKNN